MELAPQYYLGNLPSSDGKELLMELKKSLDPHLYQQSIGLSNECSQTERGPDGTTDTDTQSSNELCFIQWAEMKAGHLKKKKSQIILFNLKFGNLYESVLILII